MGDFMLNGERVASCEVFGRSGRISLDIICNAKGMISPDDIEDLCSSARESLHKAKLAIEGACIPIVKDCPYCGNSVTVKGSPVFGGDSTDLKVFCPECGAHGPTVNVCGIGNIAQRAEAIKRWNTRDL